MQIDVQTRPVAVWHSGEDPPEHDSAAAFGKPDRGKGWKVAYPYGGRRFAIPLVFGRKVDAERAAEAIANIIEWSGTPEEVCQRLHEYGLARLRHDMIEALAW